MLLDAIFLFIDLKFVKKKPGKPSFRLMGLRGNFVALSLMVVVQLSYAGVNILYKLAAYSGMNLRVLIAYRTIFGAISMVPIALVFRSNNRPKLTWIVIFQAFLCGLLGGTLFHNFYLEGIFLKSATFASAILNLNPAFTFIIAAIFRMESLGLKTKSGKAKFLGTLCGIIGAMIFALYKGRSIWIPATNIDILEHGQNSRDIEVLHKDKTSQVLGTLSSFAACLSFASWLVIQVKMSERYPCHYSSAVLQNSMAAIQSVVFALCVERRWSEWQLGWNIGLLTAIYSGVVTSGISLILVTWCGHLRGPLFVAAFFPLSFLFVAVASILFLEEKLYVGSILGAVFLVAGLYMVLWGKSKEINKEIQLPIQIHA